MRQSYYDRRESDRWYQIAVCAAVVIIGGLLWYQLRAHHRCLERGGWYSFRADICYAASAIVRP